MLYFINRDERITDFKPMADGILPQGRLTYLNIFIGRNPHSKGKYGCPKI